MRPTISTSTLTVAALLAAAALGGCTGRTDVDVRGGTAALGSICDELTEWDEESRTCSDTTLLESDPIWQLGRIRALEIAAKAATDQLESACREMKRVLDEENGERDDEATSTAGREPCEIAVARLSSIERARFELHVTSPSSCTVTLPIFCAGEVRASGGTTCEGGVSTVTPLGSTTHDRELAEALRRLAVAAVISRRVLEVLAEQFHASTEDFGDVVASLPAPEQMCLASAGGASSSLQTLAETAATVAGSVERYQVRP